MSSKKLADGAVRERNRDFRRRILVFFWLLLIAPLFGAAGGDDNFIRGFIVLNSYRRAYPDIMSDVELKNGDWRLSVRGIPYYWANGRILPESLREEWEKYLPYISYDYPISPHDPSDYTYRTIAELKKLGDPKQQLRLPDYQGDFVEEIAGGHTKNRIESKLRETVFLGRYITANLMIKAPLKRVEASIQAAAKNDALVKRFVSSINSIGCYNWREITGTNRRSYHSLGLAIDIMASGSGNAAVYWAWERVNNENWMLVPLKDRWSPPKKVIEAFENEGFVWGGKWDFYDTMHFEYRPELLTLRDGPRQSL